MKLTIKDANKSARVDLLALLVTAGSDVVVPAGVDVPDGFVAKFEAKARSTRSSYTSGGSAREVLLIGLGDAEGVDAESIRRAVAVAVKEANKRKVTSV
ncbi:MAG: hypothetical protein ACJA0P_003665, partial [Planctomycetota bacterium]